MEIGKVYLNQDQLTSTVQQSAMPDAEHKSETVDTAPTVQKDFQVNLAGGVKEKLKEMLSVLQNRQQLLDALPAEVKEAVQEILRQQSVVSDLPQGLEKLLKGEKITGDQLKALAVSLDMAAVLQDSDNSAEQALATLLKESLAADSGKTPGEAAKELLALARQLMTQSSLNQGSFKQGLAKIIEQVTPPDMQLASAQEQQQVGELVKTLRSSMPAGMTALATQYQLPELPGVWSAVKAAAAWPLTGLQPKTLQAAAELLEQLSQDMTPAAAKTAKTVQQFVDSLPATMVDKEKLQQHMTEFISRLPAGKGQTEETGNMLRQFLAAFPEGISSKEAVQEMAAQFLKNISSGAAALSELEAFAQALPPEVNSKAAAAEVVEKFVAALPATVTGKQEAAAVAEQFMKNLPAGQRAAAGELVQLLKVLPEGTLTRQQITAAAGQFVKNLLSSAGAVQTSVISSTAFVSRLQDFAAALTPDISSKGQVQQQAQGFIARLPADLPGRQQIADVITEFAARLPEQISSKNEVAQQLKNYVKSSDTLLATLLSGGLRTEGASLAGLKAGLFEGAATPLQPGNSGADRLWADGTAKTAPAGSMATDRNSLPKAGVGQQLEPFIKSLPVQIGSALQEVLAQGNIPEGLRNLAAACRHAAALNTQMTPAAQLFVDRILNNLQQAAPGKTTEVNTIVNQLVRQLFDSDHTIQQINTQVAYLKQLVSAIADPSGGAKEASGKTLAGAGEKNGGRAAGSGEEVLSSAASLLGAHLPPVLQEAAAKHKLNDLPKLWLLLRGADSGQWQELPADSLQKAAGILRDLGQQMGKTTGLTLEKLPEQSTLAFSVPLQVAEGVYYPAHIHIYHQEKQEGGQGEAAQRQFETWLRVSVSTENLGVVDTVFRLYGDNQLDVKVNFTSNALAQEFSRELPAIRQSLDDAQLTVVDFFVGKS